jgi:hypothetical protein
VSAGDGVEYVGLGGSGAFTQNSASSSNSISAQGTIYVGFSAGATGSYSLSGGSLHAGASYIGWSGAGSVNQTGGTWSGGDLHLANNAGSTATYTLSGGTLQGGFEYLAADDPTVGSMPHGTATFIQTGGVNQCQAQEMFMGNASYSLSGNSSSLLAGYEVLGEGGNSTFFQSAGSNRIAGGAASAFFIIGENGSNCTYSLSGSGSLVVDSGGPDSLNESDSEGISNTATFTQSGGTHAIGNATNAATSLSIDGTYSLSGTASLTAYGDVPIGGSLNIAGGSMTVTGTLSLHDGGVVTQTAGSVHIAGTLTNTIGTYNLSQTGNLNVDVLETIGDHDGFTATFAQSGGTHTVGSTAANGSLIIGNFSSDSAARNLYTLSGGSLIVHGDVQVPGAGGSGTLNISGGTMTVTGNLQLGANGVITQTAGSPITATTLTQSGGTLTVSSLTLGSGGVSTFNQTAGAATVTGTFLQSGGTFNGVSITNGPTSSFTYTGGSFTGRLISQGNATINAPFPFTAHFSPSNGIENDGTFTILQSNTVTAGGAGLDNSGTFTMNGTLNGAAVTNQSTGSFNVNGTIGSPVTNNGQMSVPSTALLLMSGGALTNSGTFTGNGSFFAGAINNTGSFTQTGAFSTGANFTNAGAVTISGNQTWSSGTTFSNTAGSATFNSDTGSASASPLTISATAGAITFGSNQHLGALNLSGTAEAAITTAASTLSPFVLTVSSLSFTGSIATLDLTNNEMIATAAASDIRGDLFSGATFTSHDPGAGGALGYMDIGSGHTEVRYTLLGDSNLDGDVNVADLANLAGNFGQTSGQFWINGDFDYNGNVNVADLADLAGNFGKDLSSAGLAADIASSASTVPEPTTLGLLSTLPAAALSLRRRRRIREIVLPLSIRRV